MNRNTHSWCWGFCLSFATMVVWVVMPLVFGLGGVVTASPFSTMRAASPSPNSARVEESKELPWYSIDDQDDLADFLGLDDPEPEFHRDGLALDPSGSGDFWPGEVLNTSWSGTPLIVEIIRNVDLMPDLIRASAGDPEAVLPQLRDQGFKIQKLIFIATNLKSGERRGIGVLKFFHPDDDVSPFDYYRYRRNWRHEFWQPELPSSGWQGPLGIFRDYRELVDATSNKAGFRDWANRVRNIGTDDPGLCALCPQPSNARFCPADYLNDPDTCLGAAWEKFHDCLEGAESDLYGCLGYGNGWQGAGTVATNFGFALPFCKPFFAGGLQGWTLCMVAVTGGISVADLWYSSFRCDSDYEDDRKKCFQKLARAFRIQAAGVCSVPPTDPSPDLCNF